MSVKRKDWTYKLRGASPSPCNYPKIKAIIVYKPASRYMIKKYGYEIATQKSIIKTGMRLK